MSNFHSLDPEQQIDYLRRLGENALQAWNITQSHIELIKFRENAVFRVLTSEGEQYALRIHRPGYHSDAALRSELQWIDALAKHGIDLPEVIPTTNGSLFVTASANPGGANPGDNSRQVDLFNWVDGEPLGSVEGGLGDNPERVRQIYHTIGQTAARVHNQASQWQPPADFQRHAWDCEGLVGEQPFWGTFWTLPSLSDAQTDLLLTARNRVRSCLQELSKDPQHYSMIHADFVPENLMVDGSKVRLIDFDDAGFGWHMFEIATALYFIQGEPYYEIARQALIEGYRTQRPLADSELQQLPLFLAARGFTYLGWVQDRQETETAREMTPELVELACESARRFLEN